MWLDTKRFPRGLRGACAGYLEEFHGSFIAFDGRLVHYFIELQ